MRFFSAVKFMQMINVCVYIATTVFGSVYEPESVSTQPLVNSACVNSAWETGQVGRYHVAVCKGVCE